MTIYELKETLKARQEGLSYSIWKQAVLIGQIFSKRFPKTPKAANPELYFKEKSIPMPDFLIQDFAKKGQ